MTRTDAIEKLTPASLNLFKLYAEDAANWNGTPWVTCPNFEVTKAMRGNLSDLVKKGLIEIHDYEGAGRARDMYLEFTDAGKALAESMGIDLGC